MIQVDVRCPKCGGTKADCKHCSQIAEGEWRDVCNCGMVDTGEHLTAGMCKAVQIQDVVSAAKR